jgi:hypothetical protein
MPDRMRARSNFSASSRQRRALLSNMLFTLGVGFGLDTGDTRRLRGVLELVIGEVERVHGGKFCRRENRFSIQYFDVGNAVWIDPV